MDRTDNNILDVSKVLLRDESYFHLDGYVNKQNCRIFRSEHSYYEIERSLHSLASLSGAQCRPEEYSEPFLSMEQS